MLEIESGAMKLLQLLNYFFRPGFARLNFPYFLDSDTVEYVINAVNRIAEDGWKLLPLVNKFLPFGIHTLGYQKSLHPMGPRM